MRHLTLLTTALTILWAATLRADPPYATTQSVDPQYLLAAPPADDSPITQAELKHILDLQQSRTPADIARAKSEVKLSVFNFSDVLGSWFNPDDLPQTMKLMKEVAKESDAVSHNLKETFARRRPFLQDPRIHPCVDLENTASYPSGHSTRGTVWAILLAHLFPDQKSALLTRGRQIGDDRVLAGMHFPTDVEAGRILGTAIAEKLLENPDFQAQLANVKAECTAHRK